MSKKKRVLLVDDEAELRSVLSILLSRENYEVVEANDGLTAKKIIEKEDFDLIISDIRMPQMSGLELYQWNKAFKNIPTILITGFSELIETQQAYEIGVKEFLSKPFHKEEILIAIKKTLNLKESNSDSSGSGLGVFSMEECIENDTFKYDIYLKLSEDKFVRIANKGDSAIKEKLDSSGFCSSSAVILFKKK